MGIEEKKRARAVNEYLESEGLGAIREATGNTAAVCEFKWDEAMNAGAIAIAGDNVRKFVAALQKVCEDIDYKEEIGKIERFAFCAKNELEKNTTYYLYSNANLDGATMNFVMDGQHDAANGQIDSLIKMIKGNF